MSYLRISGGVPLCGTVAASGAKNAALPIMAASILAAEPVRLYNVPRLADVDTLSHLLEQLGVQVVRRQDGSLLIDTINPSPVKAGWKLVRKMRASFCVLGPLLARRGRAVVSLPGGCNIGPRPVDLHLAGLAALGADLKVERGYVVARAERLTGADIRLTGSRGPTVTGTANVLSAAVLARGETTIHGAAVEPEIVALGSFLNEMGARIDGLGSPTLRIIGVKDLGGTTCRMIPDRIEAATLLMAAAITRGSVTVTGTVPAHLAEVLDKLRLAGATVETLGDQVTLSGADTLRSVDITARPYPGIPTDVQAQWMALLSVARGLSVVRDEVFPWRLQHTAELNRLGTDIQVDELSATVSGVDHLTGCHVTATDLRSSAALVLAGLAAGGETILHQIHHLDRGYERLDRKLRGLGAAIERLPTPRFRKRASGAGRLSRPTGF